MSEHERTSLRVVFRRALAGEQQRREVYLEKSPPEDPDETCLLFAFDIDAEEDCNPAGIPNAAISEGFPHEGLSEDDIRDVVGWARQFQDPPSDELMFESYLYYLRFDAFLPEPGAPDPLPEPEASLRRDRAFYDALGTDRSEERCREPGCQSRALKVAALCRAHHFENVTKRPCPFED